MLVSEWRRGYTKAVIRDGRLVHLTMQGDISNTGFWQELVKRGVKVKDSDKPLHRLSYADFCHYDESDGEYCWA